MLSFISYPSILMLSRLVHVACIGQYFRIITDDGFQSMEQPILESDAFSCSRQQSCVGIFRTKNLKQEISDSRNVYFAMNKIHGLFIFDIFFDYILVI